jgi:hypothetical protein
MHHEEIELNFDASCQQILGLESEILWEPRSTPTLIRRSILCVRLGFSPEATLYTILVKNHVSESL